MSARAAHSWMGPGLGPLCGHFGCCVLFAVDDHGRSRPEGVDCKRCLAKMPQLTPEQARWLNGEPWPWGDDS